MAYPSLSPYAQTLSRESQGQSVFYPETRVEPSANMRALVSRNSQWMCGAP